ncbi:hypothetical protein PDIDSM_1067 [Penicillium digitatum]|nr:hypothetical protein PDIDSM_1067 [Penicillium digitatum]
MPNNTGLAKTETSSGSMSMAFSYSISTANRPQTKSLTMNEAFEPGVANANRGGEIAQWSSDSGLDFIGEPGVPTHQAGHVLDLTFSNIPYASTVVREDLARV